MLIKTSYRDVPTTANGKSGTIRIYLVEPSLPGYPKARFPGCKSFTSKPLGAWTKVNTSHRRGFLRDLPGDRSCREVSFRYSLGEVLSDILILS